MRLSKQEQQFTLPSQLYKSKLTLKDQKVIRKQNLRSKANIPKMVVDSQNEDIDQQQYLMAKRKARKWWKKYDKKYFAMFNNLQQAQGTINKVQEFPISCQKLGTFFDQQFCAMDQNCFLGGQDKDQQRLQIVKDSIRVLFRRQVVLDQKQQNQLVMFGWDDAAVTAGCQPNATYKYKQHQQQQWKEKENDFVNINGNFIQVTVNQQLQKLPPSIHLWSFRNPTSLFSQHQHQHHSVTAASISALNLYPSSSSTSHRIIQKLLRHEKQHSLSFSELSLENEIKQWTRRYHQIFQQNQKDLHVLASRIEENIDKRKLEEELKQRQQTIVKITQQQLLWSQILLLFKKGHGDKTQQVLNDALEIITIKELNMKESLKKKKSTNLQKLKSLFQTDCKICFSTENDQKINKVFYCDGCNTSFHQICYGISKQQSQQILRMERFYCDACNYSKKWQSKTKKPSCQICCKSNFPMKLINQHFYHVTCLFMFDLAQVSNSKITLNENTPYQKILYLVTDNQMQSEICQFCLKHSGMKFKCTGKSCGKWYHPICAYLNGIQFSLSRHFRSLDIKLFCQEHQNNPTRNVINQIYIRRFFCDYKKTSNLTEEDFQEQYAKELKQLNKDRAKQLGNQNLLLKKGRNSKPLSASLINVNETKKNSSENLNQTSQYRLQQSIGQSSQQNQLQIQRNQLFQKIDHARFIQEDLNFD